MKIRNLHIRYEDDHFTDGKPYSFGLLFDELNFETSDMKLIFERLADMVPKESTASKFEQSHSISESLLKNISAKGFRLYWNCLSEMYIPSSLWQSTSHLKY